MTSRSKRHVRGKLAPLGVRFLVNAGMVEDGAVDEAIGRDVRREDRSRSACGLSRVVYHGRALDQDQVLA